MSRRTSTAGGDAPGPAARKALRPGALVCSASLDPLARVVSATPLPGNRMRLLVEVTDYFRKAVAP